MRWRPGLVSLLLVCGAPAARADVDVGAALDALSAAHPARELVFPRAFRPQALGRVALLLERTTPGVSLPPGAISINEEWFTVYTSASGAASLLESAPGLRYSWAPPRRLLLDRADGWTRASSARSSAGLSGRGVFIGVIDTGVDVAHPDLRNVDGTTRVRWLIDLTRPAVGRHPELEEELGCTNAASRCAIYSSEDLNEQLFDAVTGDEPGDAFGHGTHVASLALGNGLSSGDPQYMGVAPEAELIVGRVVAGSASILDADVLRATRFVFDRARDTGAPVVLNLSLGSDFGPHDGSSALERALSSFVGASEPGRAIVVAAGNSAGLYTAKTSEYPQPLGIHTTVHVPWHSPVQVPIVTPSASSTVNGAAYIWIGLQEGDRIEVGVRRNGSELVRRVASGSGDTATHEDVEVTVLNGVESRSRELSRHAPAAVVLLDGSWEPSTRFSIELSGRGTASLWIQGTGGLDPLTGTGALFPFASKEGTINVPASAPDLIAVGATLNRVDWLDYRGAPISRLEHGSLSPAPPDTTAYFSSAGPNALGVLKPDIVAPGAFVIGAMSASSDPRNGRPSIFSNDGSCEGLGSCFVVDDHHGIASGTSMASPIVAGAIALLFERDPTLTQERARALLQAGARPLEGVVFVDQQAGVGALDVEGALAAQLADPPPDRRTPSALSWLTLAASYARPDPDWPLWAYLELRDELGSIADGFDAQRLDLRVRGGHVREPLTRMAPGLYRFAVAALPESGGATLHITATFDGQPLVSKSVPIAVDPGAATDLITPRGGCALNSRTRDRSSAVAAFASLGALLALARRRRQSRAK